MVRRVSEEVCVLRTRSKIAWGAVSGRTVKIWVRRPHWERQIRLCGLAKLSRGGPGLRRRARGSGTIVRRLRTRGHSRQTQVYPSTLARANRWTWPRTPVLPRGCHRWRFTSLNFPVALQRGWSWTNHRWLAFLLPGPTWKDLAKQKTGCAHHRGPLLD